MTKVFWMEGCVPCAGTKRWLDSNGYKYEAVELKTIEDFRNHLEPLGYRSVPVVVNNDVSWQYADGLSKLKGMLVSE